MKKIKLLTPILTLAATASLLPLTSCNDKPKIEGEGITAEQWHKAFEQIKNPYSKERNFTVEGKMIHYTGLTTDIQTYKALCVGTTIDGTHSYDQENDKYYSIVNDDGIIWNLSFAKRETTQTFLEHIAEEGTPAIFFSTLGELFDSFYESGVTRIDQLKYRADVLEYGYWKGYCDFTFDNEYKIQNIVAKVVTIEGGDVWYEYTADFKNYGETTISETDILTEYDKAGINERINVATLSDPKYVAEAQIAGKSGQFNFVMPSDLSSSLNKIEVTNGDCIYDYGLYLNGVPLEEDNDYVITKETKGEFEYAKSITLNNPLKANDKLIVLATAYDNKAKLKLELSAAE